MQLAEATPGVTPLTRHTWGCQQFISRLAHSETRMQRHLRQAGRQAFDQPALEVNSSDRMHRLGEDAQEAFASGNPDTLNRTGDEMMQGMLKEMEIVRQKVLEKPGILPELVNQLQLGDTDMQAKAAEMLFCVVGQGPGRDAVATKQALDEGLLQAILAVMQGIASRSPSQIRQDPDVQQLASLMVAMLAQITIEEADRSVIQTAAAQGAVKILRSLFEVMSGDGAQQNVVSMLWQWCTQDSDIRQQVMQCGMAEMQVALLSLQYSPVQRQTAADQLSAYVAYPTQQQDDDSEPDSHLAEDLIHAGAPMALIEMLSNRYHEQVRCSAGQAIATLATCSPGSKLKIIAAGAYHPVVAMMAPSEPVAVRESGAVLLITLTTGDPREGPVFTQDEAAVQFAAIGAIPALVDMLNPANEPSTRVMALQAVAVLASSLESRVQRALVSGNVIAVILDLLRVLAGRLHWDTALDVFQEQTLTGMRLKCAEILASVGINNKQNADLLVDSGAVPELVVVASDSTISEADRTTVMHLLHHLSKSDQDVLAILNAMMSD